MVIFTHLIAYIPFRNVELTMNYRPMSRGRDQLLLGLPRACTKAGKVPSSFLFIIFHQYLVAVNRFTGHVYSKESFEGKCINFLEF